MSTLSLEEFNSISGINIVPKIIESKEDYMLAANVVTDNTVYENDAVLSWDARSFSFDENGYLHLQQSSSVLSRCIPSSLRTLFPMYLLLPFYLR